MNIQTQYREEIACEIAELAKQLVDSPDSAVKMTGKNLDIIAFALNLPYDCTNQLFNLLSYFIVYIILKLQKRYKYCTTMNIQTQYREAIACEIAELAKQLVDSPDSAVKMTGKNLDIIAFALNLPYDCTNQLFNLLSHFVDDQAAVIRERYNIDMLL